MSELLIGCGHRRTKDVIVKGLIKPEWSDLVTLDHNPLCEPDIVHDLTKLPLPFKDNTFREIHAYEVLEHTGRQGDYKFFFDQFSEFYRILYPGGLLLGTSPLPDSIWAWGDPSHSRIVQKESFIFLNQENYNALGQNPMSDFRNIYKADFQTVYLNKNDWQLQFALLAVKPARVVKMEDTPDSRSGA